MPRTARGGRADTANGGDALKRVKEQRYDLVLLDVGLPDIDGRN